MMIITHAGATQAQIDMVIAKMVKQVKAVAEAADRRLVSQHVRD